MGAERMIINHKTDDNLLVDPQTGQQNTVERAPMTRENRQSVFAAMNPEKS